MWCEPWVLWEPCLSRAMWRWAGAYPGTGAQEKPGSCSSHAVNSPHWPNCLTGLICCACGLDKRSSCWKGLAQMHVDEAVDCQKDPSRFFFFFSPSSLHFCWNPYLRLLWSCIDQVNYFSCSLVWCWPAGVPAHGMASGVSGLCCRNSSLRSRHTFSLLPASWQSWGFENCAAMLHSHNYFPLLSLSSLLNFAVNKAKSGVSRLHLSMHQPAMFFIWLCAVRVLLGMQRCSLSFWSQALCVFSWGEKKKKEKGKYL